MNNMTNTYTTNSPRAGIEQHTYSTGYKLSIGMSETHYSDGETLAEIAVINPEGNFVHLTPYDDVVGWVPIKRIEEFKNILKDFADPVEQLKELCSHF